MSVASAGQHLAHRAPDVVDGRHAVDLGQCVVDADVAEVGVEEALADRRRADERVEQRLRLARVALLGARLAVQARVVEGERGAPRHLPDEGDVVLAVVRVPAGARERDRAEHVPAGAQRHDQHRRQVERADQLEVLGVARARDHLLLADLGPAAAARRCGPPARSRRRRANGAGSARASAARARPGRGRRARPRRCAAHRRRRRGRSSTSRRGRARTARRRRPACAPCPATRRAPRSRRPGSASRASAARSASIWRAMPTIVGPLRHVGHEAPARVEPVRAAVGPHDAQVPRARGAVGRRGGDRRAPARRGRRGARAPGRPRGSPGLAARR